jgi:tetratricopeptide (TPR) repeat protein
VDGNSKSGLKLLAGSLNESRYTINTITTGSNSLSSPGSPLIASSDEETLPFVLVFDEPFDGKFSPENSFSAPSKQHQQSHEDDVLPGVIALDYSSPKSARNLLSAAFPEDGNDSARTRNPYSSCSRSLKQEEAYWTNLLNDLTQTHGKLHVQTARAALALGQVYIQSNNHLQAMTAFCKAFKICLNLYGPNHLTVAQALDFYGLACMKNQNQYSLPLLQKAEKGLNRAFQIRFHHLGVWHADTVDTFNKIASVHLRMGQYKRALHEYKEVFKVRRAIFGYQHPSVAVTSHTLANLHFQLGQIGESDTFYALAQRIYKQMGLRQDHQTVARLLRDQAKNSTLHSTKS